MGPPRGPPRMRMASAAALVLGLLVSGAAGATGSAIMDVVAGRIYQGVLMPAEYDDPGPGIFLVQTAQITYHWLVLVVEGASPGDEVVLWTWPSLDAATATATPAVGAPPVARGPTLGTGSDAWFAVEGRALEHPVGYTVFACHLPAHCAALLG